MRRKTKTKAQQRRVRSPDDYRRFADEERGRGLRIRLRSGVGSIHIPRRRSPALAVQQDLSWRRLGWPYPTALCALPGDLCTLLAERALPPLRPSSAVALSFFEFSVAIFAAMTAAPITSAGRFIASGASGHWNNPTRFRVSLVGTRPGSCSCFHHQSIGTTPQIACARRRRLKLQVARPSTSRWPKYGLGSPTKPRADAGGQTPRLGRSYNLCSRLRPPQRIDFSQ